MSDQASNTDRRGRKEMNDAQYYASEFTDVELDALADAGEFYLEADASPLGVRPKGRAQARRVGHFCF